VLFTHPFYWRCRFSASTERSISRRRRARASALSRLQHPVGEDPHAVPGDVQRRSGELCGLGAGRPAQPDDPLLEMLVDLVEAKGAGVGIVLHADDLGFADQQQPRPIERQLHPQPLSGDERP
jgi:hypothetical protein